MPSLLLPITRIDSIELAQERRPGERASGAIEPCRALPMDFFRHALVGPHQFPTVAHCSELHRTGTLQIIDQQPCRAAIGTDSKGTMIPQQHDMLGAEIGDQPFSLIKVKRHALLVMVSKFTANDHGMLRQWQQPLLARGKCGTVNRM